MKHVKRSALLAAVSLVAACTTPIEVKNLEPDTSVAAETSTPPDGGTSAPCDGASDGASCGTGMICLANSCVMSVCGDDYCAADENKGTCPEDCLDCVGEGDACVISSLQGVCAVGEKVCVDGTAECVQTVQPSEETCNFEDDDCDGQIDEDLVLANCSVPGLDGPCAEGTQQCQNGQVVCAQQVFSVAEVCDLEDNDCDGTVDEGCTCTDGQTAPCDENDVGECQSGTRTCNAGEWGPCEGSITPSAEVCDGLDNNCDGEVDNGNPGGGASCERTEGDDLFGPCLTGVTACVQGAVVCEQVTFANAELCDNKDNDCDGEVDEGIPTPSCVTGLSGVCDIGTTGCVDGVVTCPPDTPPSSDDNCNQLDDDCNGVADDAANPPCQCTPGDIQPCGPENPQGECKQGTRTCQSNGTWDEECEGAVYPEPEVCNNKDLDCDGDPYNVTQSCYTGTPVSSQNNSPCNPGVQQCTGNGQWGSCVGEQLPGTEICGDSTDNDCDGQTDESGTWLYDSHAEGSHGTGFCINASCSANQVTGNDAITKAFRVGAMSSATVTVDVDSTFSSSDDQDFFFWDLSHIGSPSPKKWECTITGLEAGQMVNMWVFADVGGWPGYPASWDQGLPVIIPGGNNLTVTTPSAIGYGNLANGYYSFGVGVWPLSGWENCDDHDYTITCELVNP